ncbi:hypothetical protein AVEN_266939-1, partial [Araneus ventricosus]
MEEIKDEFQAFKPKLKDPSIIIYNVTEDLSNEDFLESLKSQNIELSEATLTVRTSFRSRCGKYGHIALKCRDENFREGGGLCLRCGTKGHRERECSSDPKCINFVGEVKSVKKLNSGNLLIEVLNAKQCENMLKLEKIGNIAVKVTPHRTLNHSRGVISESEFQRDLEEDLLDCLKDQKVIAVRRITIKRNNQNFPTKHLILTFNTPVLPKSVKIA